VVGLNNLSIAFRSATGQPVEDATVQVIGNMTHSGMTPTVGVLRSAASGIYQVALDFTMAGDWIIDVTLTPPEGAAVVRRFPVVVR
jgi:hypothetical protein